MTLRDVDAAVEKGAKFVYFEFCISLLIVTLRRSSNIYFIRSAKERWLLTAYFNLITFLLGWWGLPWGLVYTPLALFRNTLGGHNKTAEIMDYLNSSDGQMPPAEYQTADEKAGKPLTVTAAAASATAATAVAVEPEMVIMEEAKQERPIVPGMIRASPVVPEKRNLLDIIATGKNLHKEQVDGLYDALEREDIGQSTEVIDAMARAQNVEAVGPLTILLEYPDGQIKVHAALALGGLQAKSAAGSLTALLEDPAVDVRNAAEWSLKMIGDEN
jgi:hypothetical protein